MYSYVDDVGKERCIFVEGYENKYYQVITVYRVDCAPFVCKDKNDIRRIHTI